MGALSGARGARPPRILFGTLGPLLAVYAVSGGSRAGPGERPVEGVLRVPTAAVSWRSGVEPTVRIGVEVGRERVTVYSPSGLRVSDALTGQPAGTTGTGEAVRFTANDQVLATAPASAVAGRGLPSVVLHPVSPGSPVFVEGKPYRGAVEIRAADGGGVTAINALPLEEYLLGVVPLEIGPRGPEEIAAVEAQSVAARTYAVSHLGAHADLGFDLLAGVEDQAYGGLTAEREEASRAVRATAGDILLYDGEPIRAYYHSTCGGSTAAVEEVLDRPGAPYLKAVSDQAPDGTDYCSTSPRYRWTVTWTPAELDAAARRELAAHFGVSVASLAPIESIEVVSRTESGRVRELAFRGPGEDLVVSRLDIRRALPEDSRILSSTFFSVMQPGNGLVEIHGQGYGHGAGMCQWGAIGRARAGQSYETILATYYPGAVLVHAYEGAGG